MRESYTPQEVHYKTMEEKDIEDKLIQHTARHRMSFQYKIKPKCSECNKLIKEIGQLRARAILIAPRLGL